MFKCEECGSVKNNVITKQEEIIVMTEKFTITSNICTCICGNEIFDEVLETENLAKAYDLYRMKYNLPFPNEIKETRERCGFSQKKLAKILTCTESSVKHLENGALPNEKQQEILKNFVRNIQKPVPNNALISYLQTP